MISRENERGDRECTSRQNKLVVEEDNGVEAVGFECPLRS